MYRKRITPFLIFLCILVLFGLVLNHTPRTTHAAPNDTLIVNTLIDENDNSCGDGDCSLRDAIITSSSGDTITFNVAGTINLYFGELLIDKSLTINGGHEIIVSGRNSTRVFNVTAGNVTFDSLSIINGNIQTIDCGGSGSKCGGGIMIQNSGGAVTVTNSTLSANSAEYGGGIFNNDGMLTVSNSTLSVNSADFGGGIYNNISSMVTVTNSTLSGNPANFGGGIFSGGTATVSNSTLSANSAITNGGGIYNFGGAATVNNSIVANSGTGGDCEGSVTSAGYNLDSDNSCSFNATGDIRNTNPLIGSLQYNGGPTPTHALGTGSPVIDAGNCSSGPVTDQRGVTRPQDNTCDMGAVEMIACSPAITVMNTAPHNGGSLRQAITDVCDGGLITFDSGLANSTIDISPNGELVIDKSLTIRATVPITISGNNATRVFNVTAGNVTFDSLAIIKGNIQTVDCGGSGNECGGGIMIENSGGAVTVTNSTLSANSAEYGGGIYNVDGALTISNSTLSTNSTSSGGGIYNRSGTLTVTNSTLSANSAEYGGGIYNIGGTVTINNSTLSGNLATEYGGGIYNYLGLLTINNSTLSGNSATNNGGGIHNAGDDSGSSDSGIVRVINSIIANSSSGGDCDGFRITSIGYSLESDNTCSFNATGDIRANPLLGSLQDNGGSTLTHALLAGSPAIDAGNCTSGPATDQRGAARPQDDTCDMGAYEVANLYATFLPLVVK